MVQFVASQLADVFRDADVLWLLDNTVALHSHVKGMSGNAILRRLVACTHFCWYRAQANIWYEYVSSGDNWADGLSRSGFDDPIVQQLAQRFAPSFAPMIQPTHWWTVNLASHWRAANA